MNILLATEVIHPGGAETFVLRLANALKSRGHQVIIFIFYKDYYNPGFYDRFANDVEKRFASIPFPRLLRKLDSLLFRLKIDISIRNYFIKRSLRKTLAARQTDIIHSHLFKTDNICTTTARNSKTPVVSTIHGDYLQFYRKDQAGEYIPLLNYEKKATGNITGLNQIVCITDKQVRFFEDRFPAISKGKLGKIYNGYDDPGEQPSVNLRERLGISSEDFVFVMVSRGIAEKGWETAIKSFKEMENRQVHLVLVGTSLYLDQLKQDYAHLSNLHFAGHTDNPLEWISACDAGLLPTTYPSESLPTVVIEYLCCQIPVIASDAGEISNMIDVNGRRSGIIVPVEKGVVPVNEFRDAMQTYVDDAFLYESHRKNTATCFRQFDMDSCIDKYIAVYKNALIGRRITT